MFLGYGSKSYLIIIIVKGSEYSLLIFVQPRNFETDFKFQGECILLRDTHSSQT